jgi:hypothetical protein
MLSTHSHDIASSLSGIQQQFESEARATARTS